MEEKEDKYFGVCLVAERKLKEMSNEIINNIDTKTLGDIAKYWDYYYKYRVSCVVFGEEIKRKQQLEEVKDYLG